MAGHRKLAVTGLLLGLSLFSLLAVNRVLNSTAEQPVFGQAPQAALHDRTWGRRTGQKGAVAKPPLYPPPTTFLDLKDFHYILNADPCEDGDVTGWWKTRTRLECFEARTMIKTSRNTKFNLLRTARCFL